MHRQTLDKLKAFAQKSGLDGDNYDLVIELLLDPEDELEDYQRAKEDVSQMPSSLNLTDESRLLKTKLKLRGSTYRQVLAQIEYAFTSGWLACKVQHARKRTVEASDAAAKEFLDKLKGL